MSSHAVSNDKAIFKDDKLQGRKLEKLISNIHETGNIDNASHDANKVIYDFPDYNFITVVNNRF